MRSPRIVRGMLSGAAGWTLVGYLVHRFVFHGPRWLRPAAAEHRRHHRLPLATSLPLRLLGHLAVALVASPLWLARRDGSGLGRWVGFVVGYAGYETTHWRIHHRPETVAQHRVEHHLSHHARSRFNHGVTITTWDRLFGTHAPELPRGRG